MEKITIKALKRSLIGKKVRKLRKQGELPANIYGKGIPSLAVSLVYKDFQNAFSKVGETGLVYLSVEGETKDRPILFHNIQKNPVTNNALHIDLYQVDLKEKITSKVPVVVVNEAKAVTDKIGVLLQPLAEIEVEALPTDLPENIEIDVLKLGAIDDSLFVKDLHVDESKITILTNPDETVVKIGPLITKEMEEQLAAEKAAAEAAAAATTPPEGEAVVSDESAESAAPPTEEKKEVETPKSE
jgi:large subunit ribosomal protein L25